MRKRSAQTVINSRHLRILSIKKDILKNAIVLICLDEDKYNSKERDELKKIIQTINQIEPSGLYISTGKKMSVEIYDIAQFKNRDVLITVANANIDVEKMESMIRQVLPDAKSVKFVYPDATLEIDS